MRTGGPRREDVKGKIVVIGPGVRSIASLKLLVCPLHPENSDLNQNCDAQHHSHSPVQCTALAK